MIALVVEACQIMKHRYIVGIDVALKTTGIAVLQDDPLEFIESGLIKYEKKMTTGTYDESEDYFNVVKNKLKEFIPHTYRSILFVIEGLPRYGHYKTAIKISIARVNFYRAISEFYNNINVKVVVPEVHVWKKNLLGRANAGKLFTKEYLLNDYRYIPGVEKVVSHDDTMDAGALTLWGLLYGKE